MTLAAEPAPPSIPAGRDVRPATPTPPLLPRAEVPAAQRGEHMLELALRHAGRRRVALRHELFGGDGLPAVLVAGGISAHRHVAASAAFPEAGWWDCQVGAGCALDPAERRILGFDWLGADGSLDAPIDPADQADAVAALLDRLGIARLDAFVGCSYGAMVGLQFAARHPARLQRLVAISGSHRAHPWASAWRALQRRALELGALQCDAHDGIVLARQMAMLGYRTPDEFERRFGPARIVAGRVRVAAEDYLDHCGARHAARVTATAYLRLSESIDLQAVEPEAIRVPVTVVGVAEDLLVPPAEVRALAERLGGETRLRMLQSPYGHDAFLREQVAIAAILREALLVRALVRAPAAAEVAA